MKQIKNNIQQLQTQIKQAETKHHRPTGSVKLLAVSKTWPAHLLREVADTGQYRFGENYLQEALIKIHELSDLPLEWHFIGPIQSNKTKEIAQHFDWVHSIDRLKIARRLTEQRPKNLPPLNTCIQVNIDNEVSKSGVITNEVFPLAKQIYRMEHLKLRGLMIIPSRHQDQHYSSFRKAHDLFTALADTYPDIDTLSMGMSVDMEVAIANGSTMVRIGTALFGDRISSTNKAE